MINNLNYMKISVRDKETLLEYIEEGDVIWTNKYNIGHNYLEDMNWSKESASDWMSYILWSLNNISYLSRIPTNFILTSDNNVFFFKNILDIHSYDKYFTNNNKVYVIIKDIENINYERYKKTISKFKI